ncbi:MAG TPA: methionine synthase [Candidatus Polarisedimenticolia bacterium]|jgi:5-methyltetrahydropteroyltriglutamate--homocysteine methyltransferase|nr:methionine synthase [Candidatus Polarisedimenticolia bacterium]
MNDGAVTANPALGEELLLPLSTIGSFPKPERLTKARAGFSRGEVPEDELRRIEREETVACIRMQEGLGLDLLVDGEMYRGDMTAYFAENLEGFRISGLVRSYGNRYYRKPVVTGPIRWSRPVTVEWFRFAQAQTGKPVKAILTGPYTMMDWSFDDHYGSREALAMALAEVIHQEAAALVEAGARYVQIDEPAVSVRPDEIELAIRAMATVTGGLKARTITHICYGDFPAIYPRLLDLPVDQFTLELSNSDLGLLSLFKTSPFTKELGAGVLDVHTHAIEPVDVVKERITAALAVVPASRLYVNPDCGLKTRSPEQAEAKLRNMVEATREVRRTL